MPIEGFDYKSFAASMAEQARDLAPADLKEEEKEYIVKTLGNFTLLAGEALSNELKRCNRDQRESWYDTHDTRFLLRSSRGADRSASCEKKRRIKTACS